MKRRCVGLNESQQTALMHAPNKYYREQKRRETNGTSLDQ